MGRYLNRGNQKFASGIFDGILSMLRGKVQSARAKGQSAVNNFDEYTMLDARDLGGDIGFVEEEVQELCEKHGVSADEMKYWYDGYCLSGMEVYNPLSVVRAVESKRFQQYWTETGTVFRSMCTAAEMIYIRSATRIRSSQPSSWN